MSENNEGKVSPRSGGFFQDIANRARLVGRLVLDPRVNPLIKLLPVGTLLYVVFPDLLPLNPVDDAFVIWLGTYFFVELCPKEVVQEHLRQLESGGAAQWNNPGEDVIDGEYREQKP